MSESNTQPQEASEAAVNQELSSEISPEDASALREMFGNKEEQFINGNVKIEGTDDSNPLLAEMKSLLKDNEKAEVEVVEQQEQEEVTTAEPAIEAAAEEVQEEKVENASFIEFKVNGKMEQMSLKDIQEQFPQVFERLKNEVSGEKEIARRFTELDKKEKTVYNTLKEMQDYVSAFSAKVKDGDIFGGISFLAQLGNVPPHLAKEQLIAWATPEVMRRSQLEPSQLEYEKQSEELDYMKMLQESKAKQLAAEQAAIKAELRATKLKSLRETHNIEESDWDSAYKALDSEIPKDQPITPTMVVEKVKVLKRSQESNNWVTDIAKAENLTLSDFEELKQVAAQYPQFTKEDLVELVREAKQVKAQQEKQEVASKLEKKLNKEQKVVSQDKIDEKEMKELRRMFGLEE